jgi:Tfp pilus assembly protein PilF/peroxiredoxin
MIFCSRCFLAASALLFISHALWFVPVAFPLQTLREGMTAPDFSLATVDGEKKSFPDLRGEKLTILVFWSTWSAKSAQALARMQKLHEKYRGQGLAIVSVNADEQKTSPQTLAEITALRDRLKIGFPMLVDHGLVAFRDYGVVALPTIVVMDRERVITRELSGYPLVGAEELADYVVTAVAGKPQPVAAGKAHYQPNQNALRFYAMGETSLKSKQLADTAELWFKKASAADPAFALPHLSLGKIYLRRGDTALAQQEFKEALAREPANPVALCESGMILMNEGKTKEGMALFETAMKGEEPYPPCYSCAGYGYGIEGKQAEAMKMFDRAKQASPFDYSLFIYKGKVFEREKEWQKAAEAYKKALEIILHLK